MKKNPLISGMILVSFLFLSPALFAQGYYRYSPGIERDYYDLNLTQKQVEAIEKLELELEKQLSPLMTQLRTKYFALDDLETMRNPDTNRIKEVWTEIDQLEAEIREKEMLHEEKIHKLLTPEQKAILESYYAYEANAFGRGGFGRGYYGRGFRGYRGRNYGYGRYSPNIGRGRYYFGRAGGRLGGGFYGYGRGLSSPYYSRFRYGRGPCGAGLGRWYRSRYGRGRWIWDE